MKRKSCRNLDHERNKWVEKWAIKARHFVNETVQLRINADDEGNNLGALILGSSLVKLLKPLWGSPFRQLRLQNYAKL